MHKQNLKVERKTVVTLYGISRSYNSFLANTDIHRS